MHGQEEGDACEVWETMHGRQEGCVERKGRGCMADKRDVPKGRGYIKNEGMDGQEEENEWEARGMN